MVCPDGAELTLGTGGVMSRPLRRPPRIGPLSNIRKEPEGVSVLVIRRGDNYSDYFGDAVWGGRKKAILAARHFRDRLLLRIGPDTRVRRKVAKGTRSRTGVVGVTVEPHKVGGRVYRRYVACWQDPEKGHQRRRFLVEHHGKERALALAVKARKAGVAQSRALLLARQREDATRRLKDLPPRPPQVKDPLSRKGVKHRRRRPRRVK